jgi:hypothetical protein
MVDISREGDEQFAGERDNRDAADPAALGANALAEPTAESTVGLVCKGMRSGTGTVDEGDDARSMWLSIMSLSAQR